MGLRSQDSIEQEMLYKKGSERDWYKSALYIVQTFTEQQIIIEKEKVLKEIARLEFNKSEFNTANDKKISYAIKPLRNKYKMFNYLLI